MSPVLRDPAEDVVRGVNDKLLIIGWLPIALAFCSKFRGDEGGVISSTLEGKFLVELLKTELVLATGAKELTGRAGIIFGTEFSIAVSERAEVSILVG